MKLINFILYFYLIFYCYCNQNINYGSTPSITTSSPSWGPTPPPNINYKPSPCIRNESELVYVNGALSAIGTFMNCLKNIADPNLLPSLYNGQITSQMVVNNTLQFNNLHMIDAVEGSVTLDFYLRLRWTDNRISMPLFWNKMSSKVQFIDITSLYQDGVLAIWLPDIRFHDANSIEYLAQTLRFDRKNSFFWSRHTLITLMQPTLDLRNYPTDEQTIHIRFGSYAYSRDYFAMGFPKPDSSVVTYNRNYDGSKTLYDNPIWKYQTTTYELYTSDSGFINAIYHMHFKRIGSGIIMRLVLPITLLLILSALTFWAPFENRVDSTITLLLSVSALYIVILANIPLLGYLTSIDQYVFWMFFLLVIVVALHQLYSTLIFKHEEWPLRLIFLRLIECTGRVLLFPLIILYYMLQINTFNSSLLLTMFIGVSTIGLREFFGLLKVTRVSIKKLLEKANNKDLKILDFSKLEIFILNLLLFQKFSVSFRFIANNLSEQGELTIKTKRDLAPTLRDVEDISNLERKSSLYNTGGTGIQLMSTQFNGKTETGIRRKYGDDSDDDDDDENGGGGGGGINHQINGRERKGTGVPHKSSITKSGNGAESRGSKSSVHWEDDGTGKSDVTINPVYQL